MSPPDSAVPDAVWRFIDQYIDTVPQLETLLMMSETSHGEWDVREVAARNYISEEYAALTLAALRRRGLVAMDATGTWYRFSPQSDVQRELVAQLAGSYRLNLARVTAFIHAKPAGSIKEFARAFDLKKDR